MKTIYFYVLLNEEKNKKVGLRDQASKTIF